MSWVTVLWSMTAAACLTTALVHGFIGWRRPSAAVHLWFAATAVGSAAFTACELAMMRATTPAGFAAAMRWIHVPAWEMVISVAVFIRLYLRAGRPWLAWTACGLRTVSLALDFLTGANLNFRHVTGLRHVWLLGEPVSIANGTPNPWVAVGQCSLVLLIAYIADAAVTAWRRGERHRAAAVGGSFGLLILASVVQSALISWGIVHWPFTGSLFFLAIVAAMSHELGRDALAAGRLALDLAESRRQMVLADQAHRERVAHLLRVATLDGLSSALAHELSQPLTAILSNAQTAERHLARGTAEPAEMRAILADIVADDRRAGEVIARLRSLLKKGKVQPQTLAPADLVRDALQLLAGDLTARGVSIVSDLPAGLPHVLGDPVQVQQVLINLILNAADAMAAVADRTLSVAVAPLDRSVEFAIADTGPGLPPGSAEVIFQPYHTTKPNGLGLGLSLSRSIVSAHGGRLWADIRSGGGAVFRFTLPVGGQYSTEAVSDEGPAHAGDGLPHR